MENKTMRETELIRENAMLKEKLRRIGSECQQFLKDRDEPKESEPKQTETPINEANRQIRFVQFQYDTLHELYCNDQRIKDEYFERMTEAEETVEKFRQLFKIMGLEYERVFNERFLAEKEQPQCTN